MDLCDVWNILSNKEKLLKFGDFLGVEAKTCDDIPNNGFNMADMDMEGRKLMRSKQIFKAFSDKNSYLICSENPTSREHNDVQGTKFFQSLK